VTTAIKPDKVRERILQTACRLFYGEGINATGVDRISEVAGVSKRSLYQRFAGKDELIAAYLTAMGPRAVADYLPAEDDDATPVARILGVFSTLETASHDADFRGCPNLNAAAELPDPAHPARVIALRYKLQLQDFFARQAALAGAQDPDVLAEQLVMLFDGAMSHALVRDAPVPAGVYGAVRTLVDAQKG
jgi:AcrR family transcriptional regulator